MRIDIPDERDPDHDTYHGSHGEIVVTLSDDAGALTGVDHDSRLYRIELDSGETADFRGRDLRPPVDE